MTDPVAPSTPDLPAAPRYLDDDARRRTVPLEHPIEYDGRVYTEITLRRPTGPEVRAWSKRVLAARDRGEDTEAIPAPVFDAPDAVVNFLDADDDDRLEEIARDFLPRRFRDGPVS